jgi:hypothetical protein
MLGILKPLKMVLYSSREMVSLKKNLKLAGLPVFPADRMSLLYSLALQFKWPDNTFKLSILLNLEIYNVLQPLIPAWKRLMHMLCLSSIIMNSMYIGQPIMFQDIESRGYEKSNTMRNITYMIYIYVYDAQIHTFQNMRIFPEYIQDWNKQNNLQNTLRIHSLC